MAKGYWVCTGTIHTPLGMVSYISAFNSWLEAVGARLLVRDLFSDVREGEPGTVNVIVEFESREAAVAAYESAEFESREAAVAAYESAEYQKLIELRTPHADLSVTITEELTDQ